MWRTAYLLLLLLSISACKKSEERSCVKGRGAIVTETRDLAVFDRIFINDFIDYIIIQDSTNQVVIKAGENLINHITTEVRDGKLTVADENSCHWLRKLPVEIEVEIHCSSIKELLSTSTGDVYATLSRPDEVIDVDILDAAGNYDLDLTCDIASVQIHGGFPEVDVSGFAEMTFYYNNSTGKLRAEEMRSYGVWADNKSTGEIRFSIDGGTLWYILDGAGNTYYSGVAGALEEVSRLGSGELIFLD